MAQSFPTQSKGINAVSWQRYFWSLVLLLGCTSWVQAQSEPTEIVAEEIESIFSTALILTDTESATLGFMAFDPGLFSRFEGDEYGSEESLERRRNVRVFAFPWRWDLFENDGEEPEPAWGSHIKVRLVYLDVRQDVLLGENGSTREPYRDVIYGGYIENGWSYSLDDQWKVSGAAGVHLLRYQNRANRDASQDFDWGGTLLGSDATALVGQIQPRLIYAQEDRSVPWAFQSAFSYYLGTVLNGDSPPIRPETWSWSNGFSVHWDLPEVWGTPNQLRASAARVEIGGDATDSFGTDNYYQFGIGWLFDTENGWSWLDNIGVSIALNVGSALSGGSLILMYNETDSLY